MNFFKHTLMLGVDIRPCAIRIIQLKRMADNYEIQQMHTVQLPETLFNNDKILDFNYIELQLQKLVQDHELFNSEAAIALPHSLIVSSQLVLPSGLSDAAIKHQIKTELRRQLPNFFAEISMDFYAEPIEREGYQLINFLALRMSYLQSYLHCMHASGLRVSKVEMEVYPLMRCLFGKTVEGSFIWEREGLTHFMQLTNNRIRQYRYFLPENTEHLHADYRSNAKAKLDVPSEYHVAAGLAMRRG